MGIAEIATRLEEQLIPTTVQQLENWLKVPIEGLECKAARTNFHGDRLMDYCVGIGNDGVGKLGSALIGIQT